MNIKIKLPDGAIKEFSEKITVLDVAKSISEGLANASLAGIVDGKKVDLDHEIDHDAEVAIITFKSEEGPDIYWHSTAHLMAQAVKQLFPKVKVTIGPAIENGFYYDFDSEKAFSEEDLVLIEERMKELSNEKLPYVRKEVSRNEAMEIFKKMDEPYKLEILNEIPEDEILSLYTQGDFTDLCRGPHLAHTGKIKAFKLLRSSGAYWRGDEKNKMLKRIYGISFPSPKELKVYLNNLEEAKKRDHRKIGKELDLFSINDDIGPGLVLWHPKGALIRHFIESYWKNQHLEYGYDLVYTPHIGKGHLWETSGHLSFYKEGMYNPMEMDGIDYYVKPMNCPFHIMIYKSSKRSYRDLPMKLAELGTVYRNELSGALHGLMRVRGFTQDDAHIICTPDQLESEVEKLLDFSLMVLGKFGFENFEIYLSTMPEKSVGDPEEWKAATESLRKAIEKHNLDYKIDEGGGAFYGPKIDIKIKDALNRSWQCTTIQFDFNLPTRFEMDYIGSDNQAHRPYMIHRALLGSIERFFGTLIEYHAGNFPVWLCPIQVKILPISDATSEYADEVLTALKAKGIRAEIDERSEKINFKVREAEMAKIPYMFVLGGKEAETNSVSVRRHTKGNLGVVSLTEAIDLVLNDKE
ncbi:threonine--tRNA ligase [bacterium]|nr:threonine--tRNA ligase [bacterium]